ncbi:hypothetical protein BDZ45DRAFT_319538 [Acephala macrosclerotiorum]|nr:hypothetical protein BDZ45DRAFT_319538 [Acephala macrosclerotiorum]
MEGESWDNLYHDGNNFSGRTFVGTGFGHGMVFGKSQDAVLDKINAICRKNKENRIWHYVNGIGATRGQLDAPTRGEWTEGQDAERLFEASQATKPVYATSAQRGPTFANGELVQPTQHSNERRPSKYWHGVEGSVRGRPLQ